MRSAEARWRAARARYAALVARWQDADLASAPAAELLRGVEAITEEAADYYLTIQGGILPEAYMSEALFTQVYDRLLKRPADPPALTFVLGFDSAPIQAEESLFDLAQWAREHPDLAAGLEHMSRQEFTAAYRDYHRESRNRAAQPVMAASTPTGGAWAELWRQLEEYLARFGHAIYDLDFAEPVLADDPAPILETLKFYLSGAAPNPYERQAIARTMRHRAMRQMLTQLRGIRRAAFRRLVGWAQRYAPLREDALADVGLGWPVLRRMLRELGRRLVGRGSLAAPDDVFWLTLDELREAASALDAERPIPNYQSLVAARRATWERERALTPPSALPLKGGARFMGFDFSSMLPAHTGQPAGDMLKGIGASPGRVTGPARVITGPEEFDQMRPGDILVARITTPAWTPLFALASGVVTDVGGPLSHSSIVAREYHIPAVLGTGAATERLRSGQRVTVDGDAGTVTKADG
jgi:pyruvate,water dikinase